MLIAVCLLLSSGNSPPARVAELVDARVEVAVTFIGRGVQVPLRARFSEMSRDER